jgi:hypothetical protein
MTRGQCGSLLLHCIGLSPTIPCRSPGALCPLFLTITDDGTPADTAFSRNKGRSRQEDRTVDVFPVGDTLAATEWHPFVNTVIRVTRRTLLRSAATGLRNKRGEVAYYLSSAAGLAANEWATAIRGHWGH